LLSSGTYNNQVSVENEKVRISEIMEAPIEKLISQCGTSFANRPRTGKMPVKGVRQIGTKNYSQATVGFQAKKIRCATAGKARMEH